MAQMLLQESGRRLRHSHDLPFQRFSNPLSAPVNRRPNPDLWQRPAQTLPRLIHLHVRNLRHGGLPPP